MSPAPVLVAGGGIAGLTAALAFAARGFPVSVFERAPELAEVGAGLQLSPNATRILDRLGVLPSLRALAVQPDAVILRDAASLRQLAAVPLGPAGERRWGSPYLTIHRADLQAALAAKVLLEPAIELSTGATVAAASSGAAGVSATIETGGARMERQGALLVGADGVWSRVRGSIGGGGTSRFTGYVAWRRTILADDPAAQALAGLGAARNVAAFLHAGFHLIVYPVRGGEALNLVAFTRGPATAAAPGGMTGVAPLRQAMRAAAPALARLGDDGPAWTVWPIHSVDPSRPWAAGRIVLIGDAAHAMTPFAAQGAAMAIEDADTLASLAARADDPSTVLAGWERSRKARVATVARRGRFNQFAWHAAGPVALARNVVLGLRPPERLAADMDWLYGWDADQL